MNYFSSNIKFLRERAGLLQSHMLEKTGINGATWSNYELNKTEPDIDGIIKISKFFRIQLSDLIQKNLKSNVHLLDDKDDSKNKDNVHPIVHPTVHLKRQKPNDFNELKITLATDPTAEYGSKTGIIPITDISVAAGSGIFNPDYIENVEHVTLPQGLMKRGSTYLCVKIKGPSMAPTLQDGSYAIIRHLDKGEWSKMPDERIYVVSDTEGKTSIKRVKNRFKQGFIILKSDSPDQANFPNTTLHLNEINTIWYVEWYLSAKMPNIHDSYYSRLQRLEDRVEDFLVKKPRIGS